MNSSSFIDRKTIVQFGRKTWESVSCRLRINDATVVVVLSGESRELDLKAIEYLPYYIEKKKAKRAEILVLDNDMIKSISNKKYLYQVNASIVSKEEMQALYSYYCFAFNLDNIAFTFLDYCQYNTMGRILNETDITMEEAVCLGIYCLREIPEKDK